MTNLASKDSHDEKSSVFSVTYHEIGETYTGLKENVTEKLSNYLLTYGAALAHHPSIKEKEEPIDPLKQEISLEAIPEDVIENVETEIENIEPIVEMKKVKKKKKKDKKEKKNKKKK